MGAKIIPAPPQPHNCRRRLPWAEGGYGSTGMPEGTLARCPDCLRWWFCAPCYESLGPTTHWRPVRWYHWRLRDRIKSGGAR